jgi:glyoxylase-like metal-dependent hydrolase (beta-lactamase superfamily II)
VPYVGRGISPGDPILIPAANPGPLTGAGNNTWLLDGAEPTLIDAGVGADAHVEAVAAELAGRSLARVLVTHHHGDHASGLTALRARWPDLRAFKFPLAGETGWLPLADGDRVIAGDRQLTAIHTPGHAPDHLCFQDDVAGDLYSGDMLIVGTTVMIPAGRGGSLRAYLASLERLAALEPGRAFPGHGPIVEQPVDLIREYIEHRRLRDRQVRACLARGIEDIDMIVRTIYGKLPDAVHSAARQTVEAHLENLRTGNR